MKLLLHRGALKRVEHELAALKLPLDLLIVDENGLWHGDHKIDAKTAAPDIAWVSVDVFITRKGPYKEAGGALVLYGTGERGCVIPLDHLEVSGIIVHLNQLEGFRVNTVVDALRADERREDDVRGNPIGGFMPRPWQTTTVCWRPVSSP